MNAWYEYIREEFLIGLQASIGLGVVVGGFILLFVAVYTFWAGLWHITSLGKREKDKK